MISLSAKAQLTTENYNLSDSLLSIEITSDTLIWMIPKIKVEGGTKGTIVLTARNNKGQKTNKSRFTVIDGEIDNGKLIYSLSPKKGFTEKIWFWLDVVGQVPMVIHSKVDGYTIYHGNVKY